MMSENNNHSGQSQVQSTLFEELEEQFPKLDPSMLQASLAILEFVAEADSVVQSHFGRYQLSQGRFGILLLLYLVPQEDWTPAKLAAQEGVSRATLTGLLQTLEKDEWILRQPSAHDKRSVQILISSTGERRMKDILPDHFERFSQALSTLSLYERLSFIQLLAKIKRSLATINPNGQAAESNQQIPLLLD